VNINKLDLSSIDFVVVVKFILYFNEHVHAIVCLMLCLEEKHKLIILSKCRLDSRCIRFTKRKSSWLVIIYRKHVQISSSRLLSIYAWRYSSGTVCFCIILFNEHNALEMILFLFLKSYPWFPKSSS
jgi:hypothetical protein